MRALIVLLLSCGACEPGRDIVSDGGAALGDAAVRTPAFERCSTLCLRPGDCAVAYNDDGLCPPGFRCARSLAVSDGGACVSDGGTRD